MRNRFEPLRRVLGYLGSILLFLGFVFAVPIISVFFFPSHPRWTAQVLSFVIPSVFSMALGGALRRAFGAQPPASAKEAVLVCAVGWLGASAVGAIPFVLQGAAFHLNISYLDAYFETMSGFTTTGITMLNGLNYMSPSLLLWRSFIQWLGGLGILALMTSACIVALLFGGMSFFDAVCHSFTALSTGGYSTHDASIAYYNSAAIDYILVVFMLVGGINFLVHFRLSRGDLRALYDSFEIKLLWCILAGTTLIVMFEHMNRVPADSIGSSFRHSLFQVVSIFTTTGFGTKDIGSPWFGAGARQIFLLLMVIGGCVGSTGGGIKVLRVGILLKMLKRQVQRIIYPGRVRLPLMLDGSALEHEELRRVSALFFAWIMLLFIGGLITALFSNLGAIESASGMFSALGNIGPCYISGVEMAALHPVVKITYIFGMLAGRLEILPVLLIFSRRAWT